MCIKTNNICFVCVLFCSILIVISSILPRAVSKHGYKSTPEWRIVKNNAIANQVIAHLKSVNLEAAVPQRLPPWIPESCPPQWGWTAFQLQRGLHAGQEVIVINLHINESPLSRNKRSKIYTLYIYRTFKLGYIISNHGRWQSLCFRQSVQLFFC